MKTVLKISALVAVLLVVFSMIGCSDPSSSATPTTLEGHYEATDGNNFVFYNNGYVSYSFIDNNGYHMGITNYSISGSEVTFSSYTLTISGNTVIDSTGKVYTKQ